MPIRARRPVSVFVRDDTVSIRQFVLAVAVPGFPPVFTVSFADVWGGLGCVTPPGRAGCNTNSPWRAVPGPRASWPRRAPRHREHRAATMNTDRRSRARNVGFRMLTVNVAVFILSGTRDNCWHALRWGIGFLVSGRRGLQEALGAVGQFPDHVCGWHYLCHQPC